VSDARPDDARGRQAAAIDSRDVVDRAAARCTARRTDRRNAPCLRERRGADVMMKRLLILGLLLVGTLGAEASQRLHVRVTPSAPDLRVYVGVERRAENRLLRVTAQSEDFFRSSEAQLDGEDSPRVNVFTFRQMPAGWYQVTVQLIAANGQTTDVEKRDVVLL
jgi:hypothetical protein